MSMCISTYARGSGCVFPRKCFSRFDQGGHLPSPPNELLATTVNVMTIICDQQTCLVYAHNYSNNEQTTSSITAKIYLLDEYVTSMCQGLTFINYLC